MKKHIKHNNPRAIAALIIQSVLIDHESFNSLNHPLINQLIDPQARSLSRYLCFNILRFYPRLNVLAKLLVPKMPKAKDLDIWALILMGLYELEQKPEQDYMIVNETVNAALILKKTWAKNLINAVLRSYIRKKNELPKSLLTNIEYQSAHPQWLAEKIKEAWPDHWESIFLANNQQAPLSLRVNQQFHSRAEYAQLLEANNLKYEFIANAPMGINLESALDVHLLPGFDKGWVSVQDGAGQFAAEVLDLAPNLKILDACAAPGSKTTHILEKEPSTQLLAIELKPNRAERLKENLERTGCLANSEIKIADSTEPASWWDGILFDRILVDAPCSALGVIRRHPDIKLLRTPEQIAAACQQQEKLLMALWPLLKPGGVLVYATCSILPEENEDQIARFVDYIEKSVGNLKVVPLDQSWGIQLKYGRQILSTDKTSTDGFYYAKLKKTY